MSKGFMRIFIAITAIIMMLAASVCTAQALSAGVVMTVSRTTQDSIINEGENLTIDVQLDSVEPAVYRWYYNNELIINADANVYTIASAVPEDAGMYKVEAYSEDGKMLVTMEFSVRVIDNALPKSGDDTIGLGCIASTISVCAAGMAVLVIRRRSVA